MTYTYMVKSETIHLYIMTILLLHFIIIFLFYNLIGIGLYGKK